MIVVGANTVYNITTKSTPENVNSFASLAITYFIAALCSLFMFFVTATDKNIIHELTKVNWTAFALSVAIVALEFGYICIYRAGWKVNTASLVANISLACVLLLVGFVLYKETLSLRQMIGIVICAAGLILVAR